MSFMGTLTKVAIGFAAAKGIQQYQKMGGMGGMRSAMGTSSGAGMTDQLGAMAERFGLPGGRGGMDQMLSSFGLGGMGGGSAQQQAGMAGLGGLMSAMGGAAAASANPMTQLFEGMTQNTPVAPIVEDNAKLMIRAMIQAAKADGEIDQEEQAKILGQLGDDATPEEVAFVKEQLAAPVDFMSLARDTQDHMKAQVYGLSLMAIRVDNPAEKSYLDGLASALGLSDDMRQAIHSNMGTPMS